jgi:hypothetical protein
LKYCSLRLLQNCKSYQPKNNFCGDFLGILRYSPHKTGFDNFGPVIWARYVVNLFFEGGFRCNLKGNVVKSILTYTLWPPVCSQNTWMCSNEMVNRLIRLSMSSYESIWDIGRKVNQCKVKSIHFCHTIKLYFRYRFTQLNRTNNTATLILNDLLAWIKQRELYNCQSKWVLNFIRDKKAINNTSCLTFFSTIIIT